MLEKLKKIFKGKSKRNLLIIGNDLKFIKNIDKYLINDFNVKFDEIGLLDNLNTPEHLKLLEWADIILCEWMEIYTIWLSNHIKPHQKFFIRAHRYEITRQYGHKINFKNVTGVITINYFLLELFSNVFSIPREKLFLMDNFIETSIYSKNKTDNYKKNIALVGYVPKLKGYFKALKILSELRKYDDFNLYLFGKNWNEIDWVKDSPEQLDYFEKCEDYIKQNNLQDHIIYQGWVDRSKMFSNIGFVLSVSDIEGSHLSPTEAFADLTISTILNWPGSSYIYPKNMIFDNIDEMISYILETYDNEDKYNNTAKQLNEFCINDFSETVFLNNLLKILNAENCNENKFFFSLNEFRHKYINNDVVDWEKFINENDNCFIANNEQEIEKIIKNNDNNVIKIFLSSKFENYKIKNVYQKYASQNVAIYSMYFLEHLNEADEFFNQCSLHHDDINLKLL